MHPAAVLFQIVDAAPPAERGGSAATWVLVVAAALFLALWALRLRRRPSGLAPVPGRFSDAAELARDELERLLGEIQEVSREHIARLDTKIRLLNQLLLDCEQKKKEIEELLGRASPPPPVPGPAPGSPPGEPAPRPAKAANPLHEQVYRLQDSGKDLGEICAATGLEKGEVELILGLRRMPPP
jgi:hypothetical protein